MARSRWMASLSLVLIATSFVGCGGGGRGATATGLVTLDGAPVGGASVTLSPVSGSGVAAVGMTDTAGRFDARTADGQGPAPGSYNVTIQKIAAGPISPPDPRVMGPNLTPDQTKAIQDAAEAAMSKKKRATDVGPATIPARYAAAETSGFKADVKDGQQNDFTFEMTSQ